VRARPGGSGSGCCGPSDLIVSALLYVLTGLGVTVGFHRLFTHRSLSGSGLG
jgi:fatty-acid desaturase